MSLEDLAADELMEEQTLAAWFDQLAETVCRRLTANQRIRRTLPGPGRLKIDRQLPFLCVYRQPPAEDDHGTRELITGEAAYLFASGEERLQQPLRSLCGQVVATLGEHFGTFLLLEVWSLPEQQEPALRGGVANLNCEIHVLDTDVIPATIAALRESLEQINIMGQVAEVQVHSPAVIAPPLLPPLRIADTQPSTSGLIHLGLGIGPIFRDPRTQSLYPVVLRELRHQVSVAIRKAVAAFTGDVRRGGHESSDEQQRLPTDYRTLGQSAFVQATTLVDQQLAEISNAFDFLLQVTPINTAEAWTDFHQSGFRCAPELYYRPLPYYPHLIKRRLFEIPIERIEDATLSMLFWEKQAELDRQLTALQDLDSELFLYSSLQIYGAPSEELVELAERVLETLQDADDETTPRLDAEQVSRLARREVERYHRQNPAFNARVEISDSIAAGVMVVQNRVLISQTIQAPQNQIEALLHHEVGTHVLTYCNGRSQSFHQMYAGLAGYEELQEGLAVLAEYLGGGLTVKRLRTLACRVLAAQRMVSGAGFVETFSYLRDACGLSERSAFTTTVRVFRGGGFTKDIIYLRGLRELFEYLRGGHNVEPLYVGKIALQHVPAIQELRRRSVIQAPAILPRFLKGGEAQQRIERCRGMDVIELAKESL